MLAVKYSDGSFYPVWWITDVMTTDTPPQGWVAMTEANYDNYLTTTQTDRDQFLYTVDLNIAKEDKYSYVDKNTVDLISAGFPFDGLKFSMSITAQINWSNLLNLPDAMFPINVMSIDEQVYVLTLAEKINFYYTALNFKNGYLQSGSVLKGQIKAMNNIVDVENFVDPRV